MPTKKNDLLKRAHKAVPLIDHTLDHQSFCEDKDPSLRGSLVCSVKLAGGFTNLSLQLEALAGRGTVRTRNTENHLSTQSRHPIGKWQ